MSKIDIVLAVWERPPVNTLKFARFKPIGVELSTRHDDRPPLVSSQGMQDHFGAKSANWLVG